MLLWLLLVGAVVGYDRSVNYWEAFAPGKLLQRLDALTLTEGATNQELPKAQEKLDGEVDIDGDVEVDGEVELDEDVSSDIADHDAEQADSTEAHSGEDYERNYEQFVRQYFDRVPDEDEDNKDDIEQHEEQLEDIDDSIETQAEASNLQRQQKQPKERQHCRRIKRQGQLCRICKEPRNNEVSETCSYSHEAEPEQYAYGAGSNYKRYREKPSSKEKKEQKRSVVESEPKSDQSSSLCVRRLQGKSICYDCKDSDGKRMSRCYDGAIKLNKQSKKKHSRNSKKPQSRQKSEQEQEQRIYKRTISYSYAQGSSQDKSEQEPDKDNLQTTTQSTPLSTLNPPSIGRRFTKILRRRTPIPIPISRQVI